jgi:hypothetical protein
MYLTIVSLQNKVQATQVQSKHIYITYELVLES